LASNETNFLGRERCGINPTASKQKTHMFHFNNYLTEPKEILKGFKENRFKEVKIKDSNY
jgi:hypothetical protein